MLWKVEENVRKEMEPAMGARVVGVAWKLREGASPDCTQ